jgi:hypothetical protein
MLLCRGSNVSFSIYIFRVVSLVYLIFFRQTLIHFQPLNLFWSTINLDTRTCLHALRRALDRVPSPCLIRIHMSLRDIPWYQTRNTPSEIYSKLDRLFTLLLLTSKRWEAPLSIPLFSIIFSSYVPIYPLIPLVSWIWTTLTCPDIA